jgi:tRNA-specific 2-thiouridylase
MSGGVDSSVAAALLAREGHEVIGCFMRHGGEDGISPGGDVGGAECRSGIAVPSGAAGPAARPTSLPVIDPVRLSSRGCCSVEDAQDARLVAAHLGVNFYVVNFRDDFRRIIDHFVDEYRTGRTPNPCIRCNDWIKFGKLAGYADMLGCDSVATGHYARMVHVDGAARLHRGIDAAKDQSYVLFGVDPAMRTRMELPVGALAKARVRELAGEFGLPVQHKPDSQDICFVPDGDYASFVERQDRTIATPGQFVDRNGHALGTHEGHHRYTVGQRRGIRIADRDPWYVVSKDPMSNTVTLGRESDLLAHGCVADGAVWHADAGGGWMDCTAQVRAHGEALPARVRCVGGAGAPPEQIDVEFTVPQRAVARGQAVVCYEGDRVLCGGWIRSVR